LYASPNLSLIPSSLSPTVGGLLALFRTLDLSFLEINPLTEVQGAVYLLDTVCRVDSCAGFRQKESWGSMELPEGFGVELTSEEKMIRTLDAQSGSSLKFILLNPTGRIWTMVAGGGASIIYADAITSHASPHELSNYGEWSGNPTTDEMEVYTKSILSLMTKNRGKQVLIIGGGIANFTDIQKTFAGIINALDVCKETMKNVHIYVRRAGPNDRTGLAALQKACDEMGIVCRTYGAELPMIEVVKMAVEDLGLRKEFLIPHS
jgi:ATP-citrate lyase beta-subunit